MLDAKGARLEKIAIARHLISRENYDEAIVMGNILIQSDVYDAEAWRIIGASFGDQGRHAQAITAFENVTKIEPTDVNAWLVLTHLFMATNQFSRAIDSLSSALNLEQNNVLGNEYLFQMLTKIAAPNLSDEELKQLLLRCIKLIDDLSDQFGELLDQQNIKLCALLTLGQAKSAKIIVDKLIGQYGADAATLNNLALVHRAFGENDIAYEIFKLASKANPNLVAPKFGMADTLIRKDNSLSGWSLYEYRWLDSSCNSLKPETTIPLWDGSPIQHLVIWPEQGFGEEIMFSGFFSYISDLCESVTVICDPRLLKHFIKAFPSNMKFRSSSEFLQKKLALDDLGCDAQIPIGSIPLALGWNVMDGKLQTGRRFLPELSTESQIEETLGRTNDSVVIGISWRTFSGSSTRLSRNLDVLDLVTAINKGSRSNNIFVNLQYGDVSGELIAAQQALGERIHEFGEIDKFNDFDNLMELVSVCDQVVTIDNVTAHLAGALGVDTTLLLPVNSDSRWGLNSSSSHWYESVSILRQRELMNWDPVLKALSTREWAKKAG